jgi:hypothetical protein
MTDSRVFQSSFDSTRFTGADGKDNHPNLAQAQAEAVTSLLLGRSLLVNNTYAFDSRIVLNLIRAVLETRQQVRLRTSEAGRQRINNASPVILRWFGAPGDDFFTCCAKQLRLLEPAQTRFILSHWKPIDGEDEARKQLADALISADHQMPVFIREHDGMKKSFETLLMFNDYCRSQDRGKGTGGPGIQLLKYLQDFETIEVPGLETIIASMNDRDRIDIDTVMKLRESVAKVDPEHKKNRSWAHEEVESHGGEQGAGEFRLQQRQLVDTLYNEVLADSAGSDRELLSSVPRSVGRADLDKVNAFALELIKHSKVRWQQERPPDDGGVQAGEPGSGRVMSELFRAAATVPDLTAPPLEGLLTAYWEIIADDDRWLAWSGSCDELQFAFQRAQRLREAGQSDDSQLDDVWGGHLSMLEGQLPHIRATERTLVTQAGGSGEYYEVLSQFDHHDVEPDPASLATAQYIDRYLRGFFR